MVVGLGSHVPLDSLDSMPDVETDNLGDFAETPELTNSFSSFDSAGKLMTQFVGDLGSISDGEYPAGDIYIDALGDDEDLGTGSRLGNKVVLVPMQSVRFSP